MPVLSETILVGQVQDLAENVLVAIGAYNVSYGQESRTASLARIRKAQNMRELIPALLEVDGLNRDDLVYLLLAAAMGLRNVQEYNLLLRAKDRGNSLSSDLLAVLDTDVPETHSELKRVIDRYF